MGTRWLLVLVLLAVCFSAWMLVAVVASEEDDRPTLERHHSVVQPVGEREGDRLLKHGRLQHLAGVTRWAWAVGARGDLKRLKFDPDSGALRLVFPTGGCTALAWPASSEHLRVAGVCTGGKHRCLVWFQQPGPAPLLWYNDTQDRAWRLDRQLSDGPQPKNDSQDDAKAPSSSSYWLGLRSACYLTGADCWCLSWDTGYAQLWSADLSTCYLSPDIRLRSVDDFRSSGWKDTATGCTSACGAVVVAGHKHVLVSDTEADNLAGRVHVLRVVRADGDGHPYLEHKQTLCARNLSMEDFLLGTAMVTEPSGRRFWCTAQPFSSNVYGFKRHRGTYQLDQVLELPGRTLSQGLTLRGRYLMVCDATLGDTYVYELDSGSGSAHRLCRLSGVQAPAWLVVPPRHTKLTGAPCSVVGHVVDDHGTTRLSERPVTFVID